MSFVHRQEFHRKVDLGRGGVLMLEAPAGHGKSCALAQLANRARKARQLVCWVAPATLNFHEVPLARRLTDSLQQAGLMLDADVAEGKLSQPDRPREESACYAKNIAERIGNHRRNFLIVLDGYVPSGDKSADAFLGELFENVPDNLTVALASRYPCSVPVSKVMMQGRFQRFDKRMLLFSKAEAREFIGTALGPTQLNDLYGLTEGWPAALQIAKVCTNEWQAKVSGAPGSPEFMRLFAEYCASEVLQHLDIETLAFLIDCSCVTTLTPDLCDCIRQRTDSAQIIAHLLSHQSFLEPLDSGSETWRTPRLLRRVLSKLVQTKGTVSTAEGKLRAAAFFEASGQLHQAIQHFLDAGDPGAAAAALEKANVFSLQSRRGDGFVDDLLNTIPQQNIEVFPRLALCQAFIKFKRGLLDEARILLSELSKRTDNFQNDTSGTSPGRLKREHLCVEVGIDLYRRSRAPQELLHSIEMKLPLVSSGDDTLIHVHMVLGILYKMRGDLDIAQTHFIQCEKLDFKHRAPWRSVWYKYHAGTLALARGASMEAAHSLKASQRLWSTDFRSQASLAAIINVALAELAYEADALRDSQAKLEECFYTLEHIESYFEPYAALYETALMNHWHNGRVDEIEALLSRAAAVPRVAQILDSFLVTLRLRFELLRGNLQLALKLVDSQNLVRRWLEPKVQDDLSYREFDIIGGCLIRMEIEQRHFQRAREYLEYFTRTVRACGRGRTLIKALTFNAIIAWLEGEELKAVTGLAQILEPAHVEGYRRVFLDEMMLLYPLFKHLVDSSAPSILPAHLRVYVESLCNAFTTKSTGRTQSGDPKSLSDREHEVLGELSHGLSNKLIARKLQISTATVNFHVRNVFRKLGVRKRASAVTEAHRRNWLS